MRIVLINGSGHLFILLKISSPTISWSAIPQKGISGIGWGCALPLFPASNNKMLLFKFQFGKSPSTTYHYTAAGVWIHLLNNLTLDYFGWRLVNVLVNPSHNHDRINHLFEKLTIFKLIIIIIQGPQKGCGDMWLLLGAIPCQLLEAVHLLLSST